MLKSPISGFENGYCVPFHVLTFSIAPDVPLQQRAATASLDMPYAMLFYSTA
jgi:hypothetical protein